MKRTILIPLSTLLLGIVIGVGGSYFTIMRGQAQIIQTCYTGALVDHVIVAARLRAGQQDKALSELDEVIRQGIPGVKQLAGEDGRHSLGMVKAYYNYTGLPIPISAQPSLADIEPVSQKSFEKLRDFSLLENSQNSSK